MGDSAMDTSTSGKQETPRTSDGKCKVCLDDARYALSDTPLVGLGLGLLHDIDDKPPKNGQCFNMGNNVCFNSAKEAASYLYNQRFEADLEKEAILVPGVMFYSHSRKIPERDEKKIEEQLQGRVTVSKKSIQNHQSSVRGDNNEEEVYLILREALKQTNNSHILAFHEFWSGKPRAPAGKFENDFIIIHGRMKMIICIEAKASAACDSLPKAARQCERMLQEAKNMFPIAKEDAWTFRRIICLKTSSEKICSEEMSLCLRCEPNVIGADSLGHYLRQLVIPGPNMMSNQMKEMFAKIAMTALFQQFRHNVCITGATETNEIAKQIENEIGTVKNILFWTQDQYLLLHVNAPKYVIFDNQYGCGKTIVMQEKAKKLASEGQKVLYLINNQMRQFSTGQENPLFLLESTKLLFKNNPNITVAILDQYDKLIGILKQQVGPIFLDEVTHTTAQLVADFMGQVTNKENADHLNINDRMMCMEINPKYHIWMALCKRLQTDNCNQIKNVSPAILMPDLKYRMRNDKQIARIGELAQIEQAQNWESFIKPGASWIQNEKFQDNIKYLTYDWPSSLRQKIVNAITWIAGRNDIHDIFVGVRQDINLRNMLAAKYLSSGYDMVKLFRGDQGDPPLELRVRNFLIEKHDRPRIVFCSIAILRGYEVTNFVHVLMDQDIASDEFISRAVVNLAMVCPKPHKQIPSAPSLKRHASDPNPILTLKKGGNNHGHNAF